jgi:hypothetical protein
MARTVSLLCSLGDMTIGWDAANDAAILPIIEKMINDRVRFFIIKKKDQHLVEKVTQAADTRKIVIPDASLQGLFASGLLTVGSLLLAETTGDVATTAEQVIENDTVAVRPAGGG